MATRRTASRTRRDRDQKARAESHVYGVPVPEGLHAAIEIERGNLSKADSVLGCLAIAMEYETDSADGPYYPDVAQLAREMVRQSIDALDSLALERRLMRNKVKEPLGLPSLEGSYPVMNCGVLGHNIHSAAKVNIPGTFTAFCVI